MLPWKNPVRAKTTAALAANTYANGSSGVGATLTGNANGALAAQDGVTLALNDRLLVDHEATGSHNGIYAVTQVGDGSHPYILTRATDADSGGELVNATVKVSEGTSFADQEWQCTTNAAITVGTTALAWTAAGNIQSLLDSIGSTQGDILYRDSSGWLALVPGTSGQVLQSGGAAANPSWSTLSANGAGGIWSLHQAITTTAGQTSQAFTGLAGATDIMILIRNLAQSVSGAAIVHVSTNNGSSYFTTSGDYIGFTTDSGVEANSVGLGVWSTSSTSARGGIVVIIGCNVTGAPRVCECRTQQSTMERFFVADNANPINAVRVMPNAGTWSAGGPHLLLQTVGAA